jgi:hypothetical protein
MGFDFMISLADAVGACVVVSSPADRLKWLLQLLERPELINMDDESI